MIVFCVITSSFLAAAFDVQTFGSVFHNNPGASVSIVNISSTKWLARMSRACFARRLITTYCLLYILSSLVQVPSICDSFSFRCATTPSPDVRQWLFFYLPLRSKKLYLGAHDKAYLQGCEMIHLSSGYSLVLVSFVLSQSMVHCPVRWTQLFSSHPLFVHPSLSSW